MAVMLSRSGRFLLLGLVLGAAGTGVPLQPVAQHAEFRGRRGSAAALQFWGAGAAPRLCVPLGARLTAAALAQLGLTSVAGGAWDRQLKADAWLAVRSGPSGEGLRVEGTQSHSPL